MFSHQPLIAESHQDSPFVGQTYANPSMQNAFLASLQDHGVKYYISGHDHIMQRSIVTSPDGHKVQEIIGASDSSKFYTPKALSNTGWVDPATQVNQKTRETSVTQDMYTVGYYVYTINGPQVTVDYYSDDHGNWQSDASFPNGTGVFDTGVTPAFHFVKKATWGYSLNGKEFLIGGGATNGTGANYGSDYSVVQDSFQGTSAKILAGTYDKTKGADYNSRPLVQTVDTGWTPGSSGDDLNSNILTLWGMTNGGLTGTLGSTQTDPFALSMRTDKGYGHHGLGILVAKDANGHWVNAVDLNTGTQTKRFVLGPEVPSDGLGTYGIDPTTRTAWAVIDYNGSYAVSDHFMSWLFPMSWSD